jgi:cell wall-associated NlpC family hydrolase
MQFTNGEIVQPTENVAEETVPAEEAVPAGSVITGDSAIGGFSLIINKYYESIGDEESGDIYVDGVKMKAVHRVPSPYENLAIANVKTYVNVRSGPSTDYKIVGKLYKGCVANVLGYEGDWVKIQSGNLEEGYIRGDYLLIGWDAEEKIEECCDKVATVNCSVLNVRTGMSTSDTIYDQIPRGESYYVAEEYEEWVKIILSQDDNTGAYHTGYVYKQYVDLSYEFQYAITKEEEAAKRAAEEAARKAEEERLRKLAEEEAARKAAAAAKKKAEEEAKKAAEKAEAEEAKKLLEQQAALATESAKLRQEVASYALNFVGNPYKWGGTSLTKGADCSGFVQSIYKQFGYEIPRVSKDQAKSAGYCNVKPDLEHLLPGDLIFYTDKKGVVNHVAMYIGNGQVVHASNTKSGIKISDYRMQTPYKARRVIE